MKRAKASIKSALLTALWLLLVSLIVESAVDVERGWLMSPNPVAQSRSIAKSDRIDIPLILHSLNSKPTFAATFAWWHSSWVPEVPFWRPLTIQTFWIEKHFFSTERYDRWMWVSFVAHLATLAAFAWLVFALCGKPKDTNSPHSAESRLEVARASLPANSDPSFRRGAILWVALAIYAAARIRGWGPVFLGDIFGSASSCSALFAWKDQPDIFADFFVFASLALTALRRYPAAIALAFIAVCYKESGWMAWVMAGAVLTARGDWRKVPARAYAAAAVAIAILLGLRIASGPDVLHGFHQGTNKAWLTRYRLAVDGCYFRTLIEEPYCFLMAHALFAYAWLRSRGHVVLASVILAMGIACAIVVQMRVTQSPLDAAIASYLDPTTANVHGLLVIGIYLSLSGLALVLVNAYYRGIWLLAMSGALVTAIPYASATQVEIHALHQAYAFESLAWATVFVALGERWLAWGKARFTSNRPAEARALPDA